MATLAALSKTAHLFSISACFGCSCWVTFVAGIVSWKALPRHTFGKLQSKLFPAYFRVTAGCLVVGLAALVSGLGRRWDSAPVACLAGALVLELVNMLYLEPVTTRLMFKRHIVERRLGTGHEVGQLTPDDPKAANNPELKRMTREFGMWHGASASANLVAMALVGYEMYVEFL